MSTPLDLSMYQRADGTWIVAVAGEIDMSNAGVFEEGLAQARVKAEEGESGLAGLVTVHGLAGGPADG